MNTETRLAFVLTVMLIWMTPLFAESFFTKKRFWLSAIEYYGWTAFSLAITYLGGILFGLWGIFLGSLLVFLLMLILRFWLRRRRKLESEI